MDWHLETRVPPGPGASVQLHTRQPDTADLSYMLLEKYGDINCPIPRRKTTEPTHHFINKNELHNYNGPGKQTRNDTFSSDDRLLHNFLYKFDT